MNHRPIYDAHTHRPDAHEAVISTGPESPRRPDLIYSVGIHPWHSHLPYDSELLERTVSAPEVVAVGECGLDALAEASHERQMLVLMHHIELSERVGKPLILHIVRRHSDIMALRKRLRPKQPWILHGYRGKPELTRQLLDHGFHFSIGERFNPESVALIPAERLLIETDESTLPVAEIAARIGRPLTDLSPIFINNNLTTPTPQ